MTYSFNGVPMDNPAFGWVLRAPTRPLSDILKRAQSLILPNEDGVIGALGSYDAPTLTFVVRTPKAHLETLLAVVTAPDLQLSVTDVVGRTVDAEFLSSTYEGFGPADAFIDLTFTVRLNGVFWRGQSETSPVVTINAASVAVPLLGGLSAPVSDALIRVRGPITNCRVTDSGGAWFEIPGALTSSQYMRFNPKTGEAFLTTTNAWAGGIDSSGVVDFGGPRGKFEITPTFDSNPAVRVGKVTVTSTARTNAQLQWQGRTAHLV